MNRETISYLIRLNNNFYREHGDSFFATRQSAWPGWRTLTDLLRNDPDFNLDAIRIIDLACGNLRFLDYLSHELPKSTFNYHAVDNNPVMLAYDSPSLAHSISYQDIDILDLLLKQESLPEHLPPGTFDLSLCFGFMHHIPTEAYRIAIFDYLIQATRPGGYMVVSFWQFMNNPDMAKRAIEVSSQARQELAGSGTELSLEQNDMILGWSNTADAYRYCHSFSQTEVDAIASRFSGGTKTIVTYLADGRSNDLNIYLVLQKL